MPPKYASLSKLTKGVLFSLLFIYYGLCVVKTVGLLEVCSDVTHNIALLFKIFFEHALLEFILPDFFYSISRI